MPTEGLWEHVRELCLLHAARRELLAVAARAQHRRQRHRPHVAVSHLGALVLDDGRPKHGAGVEKTLHALVHSQLPEAATTAAAATTRQQSRTTSSGLTMRDSSSTHSQSFPTCSHHLGADNQLVSTNDSKCQEFGIFYPKCFQCLVGQNHENKLHTMTGESAQVS